MKEVCRTAGLLALLVMTIVGPVTAQTWIDVMFPEIGTVQVLVADTDRAIVVSQAQLFLGTAIDGVEFLSQTPTVIGQVMPEELISGVAFDNGIAVILGDALIKHYSLGGVITDITPAGFGLQPPVSPLASDGNTLYVTTSHGGDLLKLTSAGGSWTTVASNSTVGCDAEIKRGVVLPGGKVVWEGNGGEICMFTPPSSFTTEPQPAGYTMNGNLQVAASGADVYVLLRNIATGSAAIWKIPQSGPTSVVDLSTADFTWYQAAHIDGFKLFFAGNVRASDFRTVLFETDLNTFNTSEFWPPGPWSQPWDEMNDITTNQSGLVVAWKDRDTFKHVSWLSWVDTTVTAVQGEAGGALPQGFAIHQNHPNPFNSTTVIGYELPAAGEVTLSIFATSGQLVRVLRRRHGSAGSYSITWDGSDGQGRGVASGVYLYRLRNGVLTGERKMELLR